MEAFVYVGTYTNIEPEPRGRGEGIYVYRFDHASGSLEFVSLMSGVPNPSFLATSPDGQTLYAANETTALDGQPSGAVSAFAIDRRSGELSFLNRQPSHGTDPCHVSADASGQHILVANYTSGSIAVLPVASDGRLAPASDVRQHRGSGPDPNRQEGPHAHFITPDPTNRFVLAADLGLDQVLVYQPRSRHGNADGSRATGGVATAWIGAASPRVSSNDASHLRHQRAGIDDLHLCMGRDCWNAACDRHDLNAPEQRHRAELVRGGTRRAVGSLRLRLEPRPRQHRDLRRRSGERQADADADTSPPAARTRGASRSTMPATFCWLRIRTLTRL